MALNPFSASGDEDCEEVPKALPSFESCFPHLAFLPSSKEMNYEAAPLHQFIYDSSQDLNRYEGNDSTKTCPPFQAQYEAEFDADSLGNQEEDVSSSSWFHTKKQRISVIKTETGCTNAASNLGTAPVSCTFDKYLNQPEPLKECRKINWSIPHAQRLATNLCNKDKSLPTNICDKDKSLPTKLCDKEKCLPTNLYDKDKSLLTNLRDKDKSLHTNQRDKDKDLHTNLRDKDKSLPSNSNIYILAERKGNIPTVTSKQIKKQSKDIVQVHRYSHSGKGIADPALVSEVYSSSISSEASTQHHKTQQDKNSSFNSAWKILQKDLKRKGISITRCQSAPRTGEVEIPGRPTTFHQPTCELPHLTSEDVENNVLVPNKHSSCTSVSESCGSTVSPPYGILKTNKPARNLK